MTSSVETFSALDEFPSQKLSFDRDAGNLRHHRAHYDVTVIQNQCNIRLLACCISFLCGNLRVHCRSYTQLKHEDEIWCNNFLEYWTRGAKFAFTDQMTGSHDDVIKWHFPRYWPFLRGIHRPRWIPRTKASNAELWCFLWSASEKTVE